ncbi:MAG: FAD-dependent oxidoreductase [Candidatus Pacebacteria bacterium]|nr:FAD-dependent oxidoreductase [Candidatus Paceibacterota bacterium]
MAGNNIFVLKEKQIESEGISTLKFFPESGKIFSFKPGQFVTVKVGAVIKAYTITSSVGDNFLALTIKRLGNFSNALCDLEIGGEIEVSGPFGDFCPSDDGKDIVFLAGGIGVTPFYCFIKNSIKAGDFNKNIFLFYSNRTLKDAAFFEELNNFIRKHSGLRVIYVFTREKDKISFPAEQGRMNMEILKKHLGSLENKNYFICGPSEMVNELGGQLKTAGIGGGSVKTEAFF